MCRGYASGQKGGGQNAGFFGRIYDGIGKVASSAWHKATAWNFEGRDAINDPFKNHSLDDVRDVNAWMNMTGLQARDHQNGGAEESKFVHRSTGAELVFDGDKGTQINSGKYKGTGNYINAMDIDEVTILNSPLFLIRGAGHFITDMAPAYILGVER